MKRFFRPRNLIIAAIVLVVVLLLARGCGGDAAAVAPYETEAIRRGDLESVVSATGTLGAVGTVEVGTQVSGIVERVFVDFNDRVERGQIMAVLDTEALDAQIRDAAAGVERAAAAQRQAEAGVTQARAQVAQAEAQRAEAQAALARSRPLFDAGYLSAREFVPLQTAVATAESAVRSAQGGVASAQAGVSSARAGVSSAQAALSQARKNRQNAEIRAPIAGLVIQRSIDAGQTVAASFSTPTLFVIAEDLAEMEILAQVDESDVGMIRPGQPATFTVAAYPERTFRGTVEEVRLQPETVQNVVTYTVVVAATNEDDLLLPGMTATVDFVVDRIEDALLVPAAALRFDPPDEVRAALREERRARRDSAAAAPSPASAAPAAPVAPGAPLADVGEVWYLDDAGELRPAAVRELATDGATTAIAPLPASVDVVLEGLEVVTRANEEAGASVRFE